MSVTATIFRRKTRGPADISYLRSYKMADRHVAFPGPAQVCANTVDDALAGGHLARVGPTTPKQLGALTVHELMVTSINTRVEPRS
jgi:hypothetical protein